MISLKPGSHLDRLWADLHPAINVFPENSIGQHALELVAHGRLQDDPGMMLPQLGIMPPDFAGGMIIQSQLCQRIKTSYFNQ